METLGIVGVSFRRDGGEVVSRFTVAKDERIQRLPELAQVARQRGAALPGNVQQGRDRLQGPPRGGFRGLPPTRLRFFSGVEPEPGEAERTFRAWAGEGAIEHLFLVAVGLDSAQVGEQEIRAQMREALKAARTTQVVGPLVDQVVTEALRLGAEVHGTVPAEGQGTSLADVACDKLVARIRRTPGAVCLIGVSPMTIRAAHHLVQAGVEVLLVNRSLESAADLVDRLMLDFQTLEGTESSPIRPRPCCRPPAAQRPFSGVPNSSVSWRARRAANRR